ncbi:hypothetical protein EDB89DRAFT_2243343 [Lactarius sanguifluus]|nr:hypothetical protein EDB89DRAFT_2243343 [Lactarius sanguifluus]
MAVDASPSLGSASTGQPAEGVGDIRRKSRWGGVKGKRLAVRVGCGRKGNPAWQRELEDQMGSLEYREGFWPRRHDVTMAGAVFCTASRRLAAACTVLCVTQGLIQLTGGVLGGVQGGVIDNLGYNFMFLSNTYLKTRDRVRYVSPPQPAGVKRVKPDNTSSEFRASGRVTIGVFSDNVLLNIFHNYLDVSPRHWPRLAHICRRWRRIVFAYQRALQLRIFCTYGTPVSKALNCWPAIPIVVQYGGSLELGPPGLVPQDEDNIMVALKQSGLVSSINLTATKSLLKKLTAFKRPFSELEDLALLSRDGVRLTLPRAFRWGPRLRCLHSTRVAIPALLQLLDSSTNLVDLQLHEVFDSWQFSPEALTNALSGMAQLQSLSLHFLPTTNYRFLRPQFWGRRAILPVLTRFDLRGIPLYLERLVAGIDAPRLEDIELTLLNEIIIGFPTLLEFVDRIEIHKSHRRAHILSSERAISISLTQPGAPACLKLQLFCEPSSEQLLSMTRVCAYLSDSLFNVEDLRITTPGRGVDYSGWRDLLDSFTGVKWFHLDLDHSSNIFRDLQLPDWRYGTMLPSLHKLYIPQPGQRHAALGEPIVSFMISRRLSGHHIAVEYEQLGHINELRGTGPIEVLSDDILLDIFRYCLYLSPQIWPTLACVCQRWRHIVLASPLGLNLRLYCTYGTPVLKTLYYWPALPIIVKYGGFPNFDPPAPEDDNNIIAALKQSTRVCSISLTVTSSLLKNISTKSEPFSELEELILMSQDNMQLTLPNTFRWGPRLRTLHSTRIAFPSFPQLLIPSQDLVDLQLHEIPSAGYFSPESFASALSGMTQLRSLSLHFLSPSPRRNHLSLPPSSGERVVLPALVSLKYRGASKYLDSLVARIDAPRLENIDIAFFSQPTMDASQLGRFIERVEMQTSLSHVDVQTSERAISISFTSSGNSTPLRLQISCKRLDWQLSLMAQVCDQFFPFLFRVNNLRINKTQSSSEQDDADSEQWLGLMRAFGGATYLHIENPMAMNEPSWDGLLSFITIRSRSGRPVQVNMPFKQCHICHASSREQKGLDRHLVDEHAYRMLCSYCGDFDCKPGHNDLFRKHLRREHLEASRKDARIWSSSLTALQLDSLVSQHSSMRAPDTVASSTTVMATHSQLSETLTPDSSAA